MATYSAQVLSYDDGAWKILVTKERFLGSDYYAYHYKDDTDGSFYSTSPGAPPIVHDCNHKELFQHLRAAVRVFRIEHNLWTKETKPAEEKK